MKAKKLILGLGICFLSSIGMAQTVSCPNQGPELIVNGDFNSGNSGFTSGYTYLNACASGGIQGNGTQGGKYNIQPVFTCYGINDRLSLNGNVMHFPDINGTGTNANLNWVFWGQLVGITPNKTYNLSLWVYEPSGNCTSQLLGTNFDVYINNILIQADNVGGCGSWNNKNYSWNSGMSVSAQIEIRTGAGNLTYPGSAGMDLLLDGISFKECICINPNLSISATKTLICKGQSVTLTASGGTNYVWSNSANNFSTIVSPSVNTVYSVNATTSSNCSGIGTITISISIPTINIITTKTIVCIGQPAILSANGCTSYIWSNTSTNFSTSVSPNVNTVYSVTGNSSLGCSASSTISINAKECTGLTEVDKSNQNSIQYIVQNSIDRTTTIKYSLSQNEGHAKIRFMDITGKLLDTISIQNSNSGEIKINTEKYSNGIYFCVLIVNGQAFDSKKMIITN